MLLTRSPLSYPLRGNRVRLACVRHAASVDSEPGSNSHVKCAVSTLAGEGNCLTRSPVDLALALFRTVLSCVLRLILLRGSSEPPVRRRCLAATPANKLTLDGRPMSALRCRARLRRTMLCLHALSSFQRTGNARLRLATSSHGPPDRPLPPASGEPSKVTSDRSSLSIPFRRPN